jgi:hypothetical protein
MATDSLRLAGRADARLSTSRISTEFIVVIGYESIGVESVNAVGRYSSAQESSSRTNE